MGLQKKHDIIADSQNNIIEHENFYGHNQNWGAQKSVKILNKVDFLNALKNTRHIKQRWIGTTLNHDDFLALVAERKLPFVKIKYKLGEDNHFIELLLDDKHTPSSIRYACFEDYKNRVGETDFTKYDVNIDMIPEFYSMKSISERSTHEIEAAFSKFE